MKLTALLRPLAGKGGQIPQMGEPLILRISVASAVVVALLAAFLYVRLSDETAVSGTRAIVTVWDPGSLSRQQIEDLIEKEARHDDLTLYRSVDGVESGRVVRQLGVVNLGSDRSLPNPSSPYSNFSKSVETRFEAADAMRNGSTPMGRYVTGSSAVAAQRLAESLRAHGVDATSKSFDAQARLLWTAQVTPMVPLILAALIALVVGCMQSTSGRRRADALRTVNGSSRRRLLLNHVLRTSILTTVAGVAGLASSLPVLAAYNGLAQWGRFAVSSAAGIGLVALAASLTVLVTSSLEVRTRPLPAIQGSSRSGRLTVAGWGGHVAGLLLVICVCASLRASASDAADNRRDDSKWIAAGKYFSLTFRLSVGEFDGAEAKTAHVAEIAIHEGAALVVIRARGQTQGFGPEQGNSLIVNTRYLQEQTVLDLAGHPIASTSIAPRVLTLLVPGNLVDETPAIERDYRAWMQFQAENSLGVVDSVPIRVMRIRPGQRLFTYGTDERTSSQGNPVVAVLPEQVPLLSTNWIASEMTTGGILFSDEKALQADLKAAGLESSVVITPVSELAAVRLADQEKTARANIFAGVLAALVLVLAAVVTATSTAERNRRSDFVRYVHGGRRLKTILLPTAVVAVLGSASVGLAGAAHLFPTTASLALAGGVVAADIVTIAVLLAVQRRRFHADTIKKS